jgi:predicted MFS family arabinose efflux permease
MYAMSLSAGAGQFVLRAGLLNGLALSCTSFATVYAALARLLPAERRGWGLGLAGAAAGLGQFAAVPLAQGAIDGVGVVLALALLAAAMALASVFALPLREGGPAHGEAGTALDEAPLATVLRSAARNRSFWMLGLGFLACGFQLAFIATHLPGYLLDRGMPAATAVSALSLVALGNIGGTYAFGLLGARYRKAGLLAGIYLARSLAIAAFAWLPLSEASLYAFSGCMGVLWLATVPLTNGIVAQMFGVRYVGTLFGCVFFGHQLGSFLGVWLGGLAYDATGSYGLAWTAAVAVGLLAAALHWPIRESALALPARPGRARALGSLMIVAGFVGISSWAFIELQKPVYAVTLITASGGC